MEYIYRDFYREIIKAVLICVFISSCGFVPPGNPDGGAPQNQQEGQKRNANGRNSDQQSRDGKKPGLCTAEDELIYGGSSSFALTVRTCTRQEYWPWASDSKHSQETGNCIRKSYGNLTNSCGNCFGDLGSCGTKNCKNECWYDETSSTCKDCGRSHCGKAWEECSGSPIDILADPDK